MSENLKPCPFCGGEAYFVRNFCTVDDRLEWETFAAEHKCPSVGHMTTGHFPTEKEAAEAWNRRAERSCVLEQTLGRDYVFAEERVLSCGHSVCMEAIPDYCPWCGAEVAES